MTAWVLKRLPILAAAFLAACSGNAGGGPSALPSAAPTLAPPSLAQVERISADPFTNSSSQHATEVEPSAASSGLTIVAAFQSGRFFTYGASDISVSTSLDGGATWQTAALPSTTRYSLPPGPYDSVSDPSVAYDAAHATWLLASLPVIFAGDAVPVVLVSRSTDGLSWSAPTAITGTNETTNDKNWIACDDYPVSPHYGRCYVEWDSYAGNGAIFMSTSSDAGLTWTAPVRVPGNGGGIGGEPQIQPSGNVIVPIDDGNVQNVLAFSSRDGGVTWSTPVNVAAIASHLPAGGLRALGLLSSASDSAGTIYVVWQDCRFRAGCSANDIVLSRSTDGITWSAPVRIPIDPPTSGVDHFLAAVSVAAGTQGASAHLALGYYSFSQTACTAATCKLFANVTLSNDGGGSWSVPAQIAGPMSLGWLAQTLDGSMVGDYIATAFTSGRPQALFALADPSRSAVFDEAMYVPKSGVISSKSGYRRVAAERPVPGFHSDHPPQRIHP